MMKRQEFTVSFKIVSFLSEKDVIESVKALLALTSPNMFYLTKKETESITIYKLEETKNSFVSEFVLKAIFDDYSEYWDECNGSWSLYLDTATRYVTEEDARNVLLPVTAVMDVFQNKGVITIREV